MSVTFSIEFLPTGKFTFKCDGGYYDTQRTFGPFDSHDEGLLASTAHRITCTECDTYGVCVTPEMDISDESDINMANGNAVLVLRVLGLNTEDLCGSMSADEFHSNACAAVSVEQAIGERSARTSIVTKNEGGSTSVECGLPADYVIHRLHDLIDLAEQARFLGRGITWA